MLESFITHFIASHFWVVFIVTVLRLDNWNSERSCNFSWYMLKNYKQGLRPNSSTLKDGAISAIQDAFWTFVQAGEDLKEFLKPLSWKNSVFFFTFTLLPHSLHFDTGCVWLFPKQFWSASCPTIQFSSDTNQN